MEMGERLKILRKEKGVTQEEVGKVIGVQKATIMKYEKGIIENVKLDSISKLAEYFNVKPSYLMCMEDEEEEEEENTIELLPLYGDISAGNPNWVNDSIEGYLPVDAGIMNLPNIKEYYFLKVNGESMNKLVKNGAFALIHKQDIVENGDIAVVLVNGYNATLKRFHKKGDFILLEPMSTDDSIQTQIYDDKTPIQIIGKYIGKLELNR